MSKNKETKEKKINVEDENIENSTINDSQDNSNSQDANTTEAVEDIISNEETQEKDQLGKAIADIADLKDKYLRAVAEFDNYKKRTLKEKTELILNGGEKTISAILPILDDFERAIATNEKTEDVQALRDGMDLIFKKFVKTLEGLGVKKIETDGKDFDVDYHEAVAMVPGMGDDKKGKVIDCMQTGYTLNDKVIRHSKVAVGQ